MALALLEGDNRFGRYRVQRLAHRREYLEQEIEVAQLEDLAHHRLQGGDEDPPLLRLRLARGHHEAAQPGARHVLEVGEVEDDGPAVVGRALHLLHAVAAECFARALVAAARPQEDPAICRPAAADAPRAPPGSAASTPCAAPP